MSQITLTTQEVEYLLDYIREVESIIEADDGTLFPITFINTHEAIMEMFLGDEYDENTFPRYRDDSD